MYADDLVLLAPSAAGLSLLLSACSYYGIEFDVKFNSAKSNVMVFCCNLLKDIPFPNFMLNGVAIDKGIYLQIPWTLYSLSLSCNPSRTSMMI